MAQDLKTVLQQLIAANTAAIALLAGLDVAVSGATPPASTTAPTTPAPPATPATPAAVKWDRYAVKNPVVPVGAAGSWNSAIVGDPTVLGPDKNYPSTYTMFFFGFDGANAGSIGAADSADGYTWKEHAGNPMFAGAKPDRPISVKPSVVLNPSDNTYYMAYAASGGARNPHLRLAKSKPGDRYTGWTDVGVLLEPDGSAVEGARLDCPRLVALTDGTFRLYYAANQALPNEPLQACVATMATITSKPVRYSGNPIAGPTAGSKGILHAIGAFSPRQSRSGLWEAVYNAFSADNISRVFKTTSTDGLTWKISEADLILDQSPYPEWDSQRVYAPFLLNVGGTDVVYYNALMYGENIGMAKGGATSVAPFDQGAGTTAPAPAAGMKLVFLDDFNGTSLDTKKWFLGGKPSSDGAQWGGAHFVGATEPGSVDIYKVTDGILTITARYDANYKDPEGWGRKWRSGHLSAAFPGGVVTGAARKGYFEARMKMPKNPGAWSAFWLLNVASIDQTKKPVTVEEDIVEAYGHDVNSYMFTQHDWRGPGNGAGNTNLQVTRLPDLSADFHTYGARITDTEIIVYFDGVERGRKPLAEAAVVDPFFVLLDLAISQDWPVTVPPSNSINLLIDYVRVWSAD